MTGTQAGIVTESAHGRARILEIRTDRIKTLLLDQLISPVLWHQSIHYLNSNLGVKSFMEVGPKNVLTGLFHCIVFFLR